MNSCKISCMNTRRILILIRYLLVFIIGIYIGQNSTYIRIFQGYAPKHLLIKSNVNKSLLDVSNERSFLNLGIKYQTDKVTYHRYDKMYEKYLHQYIESDIALLEIGLGCEMTYGPGASAYLWRHYFGNRANIHFIEFNRNCGKEWYRNHGEKLNVIMHYGSQEDIAFLKTVNNGRGYFDIIIDDGGHTMKQQITSFIYLFPKVRSGGLYVIEDLQTSYFTGFNSGYLVNITTIEFIKRLVDDIQADSPRKTIKIAEQIFSFDISNKICVFTKM